MDCASRLLLFNAKASDRDVVAAQCFAGVPVKDLSLIDRINQRHHIEDYFDVALRKKSAG